jgi:hypothetical protein
MIRKPVVPGRPLTQGHLLTPEGAVREAAGAYLQAETEIRVALARYARSNLDPTIGRAARAQQRTILLARIGELQADLKIEGVNFATDSLGRVYLGGMSRADRALAIGGVSPRGSASFVTIHREAFETLVADAYDDLAAATDYMAASAKRQIREATKLRTLVNVAAGDGVDVSRRRLVDELERRGVDAFVDRAGHRWRLSTYAEMVVRTKSAHGYNTGTLLRCEENGTTVVSILDGDRSGHEACLAYHKTTATTGWALDHPIEHPNCVRTFLAEPLHRGPVDHGTADGPSAGAQVADEAERRRPDVEPESVAAVPARTSPARNAGDLTRTEGERIASLAMDYAGGRMTGREYRAAVRQITGNARG